MGDVERRIFSSYTDFFLKLSHDENLMGDYHIKIWIF